MSDTQVEITGNTDTRIKNYEKKKEANKRNGKLGGRPKTNLTEDNPKNPNGLLETQPNPKNLKEKDMDKDKVKEAEINFLWVGNEVVDLWNEWKDYKQKHFKFKYKTLQSEQAAFDNLVDLSNKNFEIAKEIVKQSMANGWKGFFQHSSCLF